MKYQALLLALLVRFLSHAPSLYAQQTASLEVADWPARPALSGAPTPSQPAWTPDGKALRFTWERYVAGPGETVGYVFGLSDLGGKLLCEAECEAPELVWTVSPGLRPGERYRAWLDVRVGGRMVHAGSGATRWSLCSGQSVRCRWGWGSRR
jgi:hypothetical protein